MQRLIRLVALTTILGASLVALEIGPAAVGAQECSGVGDAAPDEGMAQQFREAYDAAPGDLGSPVSGERGCVHRWDGTGPWTQTFEGPDGLTNLMHQEITGRVHRLYGDWLGRYEAGGGPDVYGAPLDDPHDAGPQGVEQYFDGGVAGRSGFFRRDEGEPVFVVQGEILDRYVEELGTSGRLGAPTSEEVVYQDWEERPVVVRSNFEGGFILCCDEGAEVLTNDQQEFNASCTQGNHLLRKSFNSYQDDERDDVDAVFRYEVYYRAVDCADAKTYQITRVNQWIEEPSLIDVDYYWESVAFGYYDEDHVEGDRRPVGCEPMSYDDAYRQPVVWFPEEDWIVSFAPDYDTFGSKISNSNGAGLGCDPVLLNSGETYEGAVIFETAP